MPTPLGWFLLGCNLLLTLVTLALTVYAILLHRAKPPAFTPNVEPRPSAPRFLDDEDTEETCPPVEWPGVTRRHSAPLVAEDSTTTRLSRPVRGDRTTEPVKLVRRGPLRLVPPDEVS